jgi:hypothetical protein
MFPGFAGSPKKCFMMLMAAATRHGAKAFALIARETDFTTQRRKKTGPENSKQKGRRNSPAFRS